MYLLVDCNNFFASCEQVFSPHLRNCPLVVLSNNDGCVIARSKEAKAIGIKMGAPLFKLQQTILKHDIAVCSSNFALYGDFSSRVMSILSSYPFTLEIYSIDEAFLEIPQNVDPQKIALQIKKQIKDWLGLCVSIGIAPTKTLAKVANHLSKTTDKITIFPTDRSAKPHLLEFPVEKVWGIGRRYAKKLHAYHIKTVGAFLSQEETWIKKQFGVFGYRTLLELKGKSCIPVEEKRSSAKSLIYSRSFASEITSLDELSMILSSFAAKAAAKLRKQKLVAARLGIYIATNRFLKKYVMKDLHIKLTTPTNYTPELIRQAKKALSQIYTKTYSYKKAGILLYDLSSEESSQVDFFTPQDPSHKKLMATLDGVNRRFGANTLSFASEQKATFANSSKRSPCYTTKWSDILKIPLT